MTFDFSMYAIPQTGSLEMDPNWCVFSQATQMFQAVSQHLMKREYEIYCTAVCPLWGRVRKTERIDGPPVGEVGEIRQEEPIFLLEEPSPSDLHLWLLLICPWKGNEFYTCCLWRDNTEMYSTREIISSTLWVMEYRDLHISVSATSII